MVEQLGDGGESILDGLVELLPGDGDGLIFDFLGHGEGEKNIIAGSKWQMIQHTAVEATQCMNMSGLLKDTDLKISKWRLVCIPGYPVRHTDDNREILAIVIQF